MSGNPDLENHWLLQIHIPGLEVLVFLFGLRNVMENGNYCIKTWVS